MSGGFPLVLEICNGNDMGTNTAGSIGTAIVGGANDTKGSYFQISASTPLDIEMLAICIQETGNATKHAFLDVAIGASGHENVIISNLMIEGGTNGSSGTDYLFPVSIPKGTRVAVRLQNGSTSADGGSVNMIGFDGGFNSQGFAGVDDIGSVLSTTFGTLLTANATPFNKGAYVQLTSSTARDYAGFWIRGSQPSSGTGAVTGLVDIAIGPPGSETVIIPNMQMSWIQVPPTPIIVGPFWIPIPAGTAISARLEGGVASVTGCIQLHAVYQ